MHESFPFVQRCRQENPYFQSWVLNHAEVSPDFPIQPPYSAEFEVPGPAQDLSQLEALSGRLGKRRGAGPKKERRRTESINSAFAELRECIPNVPADTKLSKIKTLRLATSYIAYLMDVLAKDSHSEETEGFKAEIKKFDNRDTKRKREPLDKETPVSQPRFIPVCGERTPSGIAGERKEVERQDGLASAGLGSGTQPVTRERELQPTFHMDSDRIHQEKQALHRREYNRSYTCEH
ncbi:HAND1 protein, partial [Polyodon spathula]|nr:HAND1 protein [Polyodon spathula]